MTQSMETAAQVMSAIHDNILTINVLQGRKDVMRIVPEMFYHRFPNTENSVLVESLWNYYSKHIEAVRDDNQHHEEQMALGTAYFIPTRLLFE